MKRIDKNLQFKNNPRKITDTQLERLEDNLLKFGDLSGVVFCRNNNAYVGGNQRSKIFDGSQITITESFDKPQPDKTVATGFIAWKEHRYSYREVEFTEQEFREACIVANNDGGTWDFEVLANEWDNDLLNDWGLAVSFSNTDVNLEDFFDANISSEKIKKAKLCPHCGEDINKQVE